MKKGIIFDMDGTLWDAVDNIVISWSRALKELNQDVLVSRERLLGLMGKTMDAFARELFPNLPLEEGMELFHKLELVENEYLKQQGALLLGDVEAVFQQLRDMGYGVYIVSNCQAGYIEAFLEYYQWEHLVEDIECFGNTNQGKAANLRLLIERNHLDAYWYVGDTQGDYDACKEAGVPFVFAAYGFGQVEPDGERWVIGKLEEITTIQLG